VSGDVAITPIAHLSRACFGLELPLCHGATLQGTLDQGHPLAVLRQVADPGNSEGALWAGMRIHLVPNDVMSKLGYSSKLNAEWDFMGRSFLVKAQVR